MDRKKEPSESVKNVPVIKEDLKRSNDVHGDSIQHLNDQLLEAQELAGADRRTCIELRGHLEEARRENLLRAEESGNQIKLLHGQLKQLQDEMGLVKQQRDDASNRSLKEVQGAVDEARSLRAALEEHQRLLREAQGNADQWRQAAGKHQSEIDGLQQQGKQWQKTAEIQAGEVQSMHQECVSLQKECSGLRSEKQDVVNKYEKEKGALQKESAALRAEKEDLLRSHHAEKASLQADGAALRSDNNAMLKKQQQLDKDLTSARGQNAELSSSLEALERSQEVLEKRLAELRSQHREDSTSFQARLEEAGSHATELQRECDDARAELSDLKERHESSEQEKQSITEQLQECTADMKALQDRGSKMSLMLPVQATLIGLVLALLLWCFGAVAAPTGALW